MPSTYSPNLRIELIASGEQSGTWGVTTNTNLGTLIEDAIAGYVSVSITSANQALTALNGAADESRNMIINLTTTTTADFNVYIPPADKFYVIRNTTAYNATIYCSTVLGNTTAAGTGVTVLANSTTIIFSDGTNVRVAIDSFSASSLVAANLTVNGNSTLGDTAADTLTVNSTITSNLIFTDNTYDIGASGATRPRNLFLAGNATIGGNQTLTGTLTVDSTTDSSSTTTGSIQTDGGMGVAKALYVGTTLNVAGNTTLGDASTDTVTVNGYMGVGGAGVSQNALNIISTGLTGASACRGVNVAPTFQLGTTTSGSGVVSAPSTAAASFTMANMYSFAASNGTKGAGSTITNQYGFQCDDLTRGDNIFGFSSAVSSGANKWNIYASGTAANYFAGNVGIGTSSPVANRTLSMQNSATTIAGIQLLDSGGVNRAQIELGGAAAGSSAQALYVNATTNLLFNTAAAERMRIDSSGNVGIGTSSPNANAKLDVTGSVRAVDEKAAINSTFGSFTAERTTNDSRLYIGYRTTPDAWVIGATYSSTGAFKPIVFATSDTERMRITSAGEVLVGGTTELGSGTRGIVSIQGTNANPSLNLYRNDTTIVSGDGIAEIAFYGNDTTSNTPTNLAYISAVASGTHAAGDNPTDIVFGTTPDGTGTVAEAGRITQSGAYVLKGGTTTAAAGVGIIFPATQVASADANCLDDYEEGTFTPTVSGSTVAGTGTYNTQVGTYTKIGRLVTVTVTVGWTAHTGTGNLRVSNLPFTSANITGAYSTFVMDYVNLTVPASSLAFGEMGPNITYANLFSTPTGTGSSAGLAMDTAATLYFSLTYQAS